MQQLSPVRWEAGDLIRHLDNVLDIYAEAMGYPADTVESRRGFVAAHTRRPGFRAVATLDAEGSPIGFGYGYDSAPGQWWHEQVRAGLEPSTYRAWMADCFEVVELHVQPTAQGHGLGYSQLLLLLDDVPRRTVVLSTPEGESRAWRLYRRTGFVDVLRDYAFPGDNRPFAILGRSLPMDLPGA